jgi:hypothetical protein
LKGPSSDVLTAVDKTIDEGWADKDNLLITGGSYAGYLTHLLAMTIVSKLHVRNVEFMITPFFEGNAWRLVPNYFEATHGNQKLKKF